MYEELDQSPTQRAESRRSRPKSSMRRPQTATRSPQRGSGSSPNRFPRPQSAPVVRRASFSPPPWDNRFHLMGLGPGRPDSPNRNRPKGERDYFDRPLDAREWQTGLRASGDPNLAPTEGTMGPEAAAKLRPSLKWLRYWGDGSPSGATTMASDGDFGETLRSSGSLPGGLNKTGSSVWSLGTTKGSPMKMPGADRAPRNQVKKMRDRRGVETLWNDRFQVTISLVNDKVHHNYREYFDAPSRIPPTPNESWRAIFDDGCRPYAPRGTGRSRSVGSLRRDDDSRSSLSRPR
mmetsp:Transcript_95078/g.217725  ORF Transcript_95078/g.217725 Transcript_95078/m.217725 type:complete len:291 (+) Transcript_95078:52-924(+)